MGEGDGLYETSSLQIFFITLLIWYYTSSAPRMGNPGD